MSGRGGTPFPVQASVFTRPDHVPLRRATVGDVSVSLIGVVHGVVGGSPEQYLVNQLLRDGKFLPDLVTLQAALANISGNFAVILQDANGHVVASVDRIRSFPLFYRIHADGVRIANHPSALESAGDLVDPTSLLEFRMAGYVTGGHTLIEGIRQLQAGQALVVGDTITITSYYRFYEPEVYDGSERDALRLLGDVSQGVFDRVIKRLRGRPVFVPLSGGLDSRFVLAMLKEGGHRACTAFSYGLPGNHEARRASQVARALGVPWFFVPYSHAAGRSLFRSSQYRAYAQFAHQRTAIPFILDFPAIEQLMRAWRLPGDAVVMNGQTGDFISGGHIRAILDQPVVSHGTLVESIRNKHLGLWKDLNTPEHVHRVASRVHETLERDVPDSCDREEAMKQYECWEWRARQSVYVVHGQRAYDFYGIAWELPLWDDAFLWLWSRMPFRYKFQQYLYRSFLLQRNPGGVFSDASDHRYISPWYMGVLQQSLRIFGARRTEIAHRILAYWQNYSYYYALYPYREYLRHARFHKSAISFHAKYCADAWYGEAHHPSS